MVGYERSHFFPNNIKISKLPLDGINHLMDSSLSESEPR